MNRTRRRVVASLAACVAAVLAAGILAPSAADDPGSRPAGPATEPGVRLTLTFDREFYLPTEDIRATVAFATDSGKPVSLWHTSLSGDPFGLSLEVKEPAGAPCKFIGKHGDGPPFARVISKGQPWSYSYQLRRCYQFGGPGEYQVTAKYVDRPRGQNFSSQPCKVRLVQADGEKVVSTRTVHHPDQETGYLYELVQVKYKGVAYYLLRESLLNPTLPGPNPHLFSARRIECEGLEQGRIAETPVWLKGGYCWKIALPGDNTLLVCLYSDDTGRVLLVKAPRKAEDLTVMQDGPKYSPLFLVDKDGKEYKAAGQPAATRPDGENKDKPTE